MGAFKHILSSKETKKKRAKKASISGIVARSTANEPMAVQGDWRVVMHKDEMNGVWIAQPQHHWGNTGARVAWRAQVPKDPFDYNSYSTPMPIAAFKSTDKDKAYEQASEWTKAKKDEFTRRVEAKRIARETQEIHVIK